MGTKGKMRITRLVKISAVFLTICLLAFTLPGCSGPADLE